MEELKRRVAQLEALVADQNRIILALRGDAEKWQAYQARKVRLTEAGFGKSPLREEEVK